MREQDCSGDLVLQFRNFKVVYRRYAGLFFCICVDANDNELAYLEAIHLFVEVLGTSNILILISDSIMRRNFRCIF